jgi:hypothetical protein
MTEQVTISQPSILTVGVIMTSCYTIVLEKVITCSYDILE